MFVVSAGYQAPDDARSKTGKFERGTGSPDEIDEALQTGNAFWIYTKDPNVSAFTDLMNRAIDKPAEHVQVAGSDGGPIVIRWQRDNDDNEQVLQRSVEMDDEIAGI